MTVTKPCRLKENINRTRNTWLAKPRVAGAGWKALFTRIVASNEEIKRGIGFFFDEHGLFVVPQASLRLKIYFWRAVMYNGRAALSWWLNLFPTENYFSAAIAVENLFLTRRNVQLAWSAVVFDEFISHGKFFYGGHKTCNFFNAIFHKKDFWKKGKRFWRDSSVSSEYWWTLQLKFDPARKLSLCMQILL